MTISRRDVIKGLVIVPAALAIIPREPAKLPTAKDPVWADTDWRGTTWTFPPVKVEFMFYRDYVPLNFEEEGNPPIDTDTLLYTVGSTDVVTNRRRGQNLIWSILEEVPIETTDGTVTFLPYPREVVLHPEKDLEFDHMAAYIPDLDHVVPLFDGYRLVKKGNSLTIASTESGLMQLKI